MRSQFVLGSTASDLKAGLRTASGYSSPRVSMRSRHPPLVVAIIDSKFETRKHIALIVALRVKITNTTDKTIRIRSYGFSCDAEGEATLHYTLSREDSLELDREVSARSERQDYGIPLAHHATVPADESVTGWVVTKVARPAAGGIPAITVTVKDQLGNEYHATRPKEEPKVYN
jgi:hypothetical protein